MRTDNFYKTYGIEERNDLLIQIGKNNWLLVFGFYQEAEGVTFCYRKNYNNKPTIAELKTDIEGLINKVTDEAILNGFTWNDMPVYLSTENQMNFKAVYDLAVQNQSNILPIKFKLGENEDNEPIYYVFSEIGEFTDFYLKAVSFINKCLTEGWTEKDAVDYNKLLK